MQGFRETGGGALPPAPYPPLGVSIPEGALGVVEKRPEQIAER